MFPIYIFFGLSALVNSKEIHGTLAVRPFTVHFFYDLFAKNLTVPEKESYFQLLSNHLVSKDQALKKIDSIAHEKGQGFEVAHFPFFLYWKCVFRRATWYGKKTRKVTISIGGESMTWECWELPRKHRHSMNQSRLFISIRRYLFTKTARPTISWLNGQRKRCEENWNGLLLIAVYWHRNWIRMDV